jgi:hypothetical protein
MPTRVRLGRVSAPMLDLMQRPVDPFQPGPILGVACDVPVLRLSASGPTRRADGASHRHHWPPDFGPFFVGANVADVPAKGIRAPPQVRGFPGPAGALDSQ